MARLYKGLTHISVMIILYEKCDFCKYSDVSSKKFKNLSPFFFTKRVANLERALYKFFPRRLSKAMASLCETITLPKGYLREMMVK